MHNRTKNGDQSELKVRLRELHDHLASTSSISAEDKALLSSMVNGILQLTEDQQLTPEAADEHNLRELFEQKSLIYEAQHRQLAFTLHEVLDILARMGI